MLLVVLVWHLCLSPLVAPHVLQSNESTLSNSLFLVDVSTGEPNFFIERLRPLAQVHLLHKEHDALYQILKATTTWSISTTSHSRGGIHILSAGSPGGMHLGSSVLNSNTILSKVNTLHSLSEILAGLQNNHSCVPIFLYGCSIAAGTEGRRFVDQVAELLQTSVHASTDVTGSSMFNGNWNLEYSAAPSRCKKLPAMVTAATAAALFSDFAFHLQVVDILNTPMSFDSYSLISGSGYSLNTQYRYSNIFTFNGQKYDAIMRLGQSANVLSFVIDANSRTRWFEPRVFFFGAGFVEFYVRFVLFGTNTPAQLSNFLVTVLDSDGSSTASREYVEIGGYSSITVSGSTQLTPAPATAGAMTRFTGKSVNTAGPEFENTCAFVASFGSSTEEIRFRVGFTSASTWEREYAIIFGGSLGTFGSPVTRTPPTVTSATITANIPQTIGGTYGSVLFNIAADTFTVVVNGVTYTASSSSVSPGLTVTSSTWSVTVTLPSGTHSVTASLDKGVLYLTDQTSNEITAIVASSTPSATVSRTRTPSATRTRTATVSTSRTRTPSATRTRTSTVSATGTRTTTVSPSATSSMSATATNTATITPSATISATSTLSPSHSATWTPTVTQTASGSVSATNTASETATCSETSTLTSSASATLSASNTLTSTATMTQTSTVSVTTTSSATFSTTSSQTGSPTPSLSGSPLMEHQLGPFMEQMQQAATPFASLPSVQVSLESSICREPDTQTPYLIVVDSLAASRILVTGVSAPSFVCVAYTSDNHTTTRLHFGYSSRGGNTVVVEVSATALFSTTAEFATMYTVHCSSSVSVGVLVISSAWPPIWRSLGVLPSGSSFSHAEPMPNHALSAFVSPNSTITVAFGVSGEVNNGDNNGETISALLNAGVRNFSVAFGTSWTGSFPITEFNQTRITVDAPLPTVLCGRNMRSCGVSKLTIGFDLEQRPIVLSKMEDMLCGSRRRALHASSSGSSASSQIRALSTLAANGAFLPAPLACPPFCASSPQYHALVAGNTTWHIVMQQEARIPPSNIIKVVEFCMNPQAPTLVDTLAVCSNETDPRSQACMYGDSAGCFNCPTGGLCIGGRLLRSRAGFWLASEQSDVLMRCSAPATDRCPGWSMLHGSTLCGPAYKQGSIGCTECAAGYYPTLDDTCNKCPTTTLDFAFFKDILVIAASIIALGVVMCAASFGLQKWRGVEEPQTFRRVLRFVIATYTAVQMLAQVATFVPPGMPENMVAVYKAVSALQGTGVGVHPVCLGGSLFLVAWIKMSLGLLLAFVYACAGRCKAWLCTSERIQYILSTLQRVSSTIAAAIFALFVNACLQPLSCGSASVTFRTYINMVKDGQTISNNANFASKLGLESASYEDVLERALEDPHLMDEKLPISYMYSNPNVVCFEGDHTYVAIMAVVSLLLFVVAFHGWLFYAVAKRAQQLYMQTVRTRLSFAMMDVSYALSKAPMNPLGHTAAPPRVTKRCEWCSLRQKVCGRIPKTFDEHPVLESEQTLAYYLRGDYRVSVARFRFLDSVFLLLLGIIASFVIQPQHNGLMAPWISAALVTLLCILLTVCLLSFRPYAKQAKWLYPFRFALIATTMLSAWLTSAVMSLDHLYPDPDASERVVVLSYVTFGACVVCVVILVLSFIYSMLQLDAAVNINTTTTKQASDTLFSESKSVPLSFAAKATQSKMKLLDDAFDSAVQKRRASMAARELQGFAPNKRQQAVAKRSSRVAIDMPDATSRSLQQQYDEVGFELANPLAQNSVKSVRTPRVSVLVNPRRSSVVDASRLHGAPASGALRRPSIAATTTAQPPVRRPSISHHAVAARQPSNVTAYNGAVTGAAQPQRTHRPSLLVYQKMVFKPNSLRSRSTNKAAR